MRMVRYSNSGWTTQYQSHMAREINYLRTADMNDYNNIQNEYMRKLCIAGHHSRLSRLNANFPLFGVHAFFEDTSEEIIRHFLNHLTARPERHVLDFDPETPAFPLEEPFEHEISTLRELHSGGRFGAYIPIGS
jgi:hypothetical protein